MKSIETDSSFRVIMFNVGSGDHLLLHFPDNSYAIIDFHFQRVRLNQTEPPAISHLRHVLEVEGKVELAFICISHYDYDHIWGIERFFEWYTSVNENEDDKKVILHNIWLAGAGDREELRRTLLEVGRQYIDTLKENSKKQEKQFQRYEERFQKYNTRYEKIEDFIAVWRKNTGKSERYIRSIKDCNGNISSRIRVYSIAPLEDHIKSYRNKQFKDIVTTLLFKKEGKQGADHNLVSSILFFEHKFFRCCFGGDASAEVWLDSFERAKDDKISHKYPIKSVFTKVSHHGSHKSSNKKIWKRLLGKSHNGHIYFGFSAGKKYNHPHSDTLQHISQVCKGKEVVLATNACSICVNERMKYKISNEIVIKLEEIDESGSKGEWVEQSVFLDQDTVVINESPTMAEKDLWAYILDFSVKNGDLEISKSMTSRFTEDLPCLFAGHHKRLPCCN